MYQCTKISVLIQEYTLCPPQFHSHKKNARDNNNILAYFVTHSNQNGFTLHRTTLFYKPNVPTFTVYSNITYLFQIEIGDI